LVVVERQISVLFSDIRGYTSFCSGLKPEAALLVLNAFHACMTRTISEHGGIVNQLVGDGMMAIFGATEDLDDHADKAISAGRAMLKALPNLNEEIRRMGHEDLRIGVGVNSGLALVGTIGSPGRMEFTAVGDVVNVAARIEALTKDQKSPLLFSKSTFEMLPELVGVVEMPALEVHGKKKPIVTYTFEELKGTLR
jgi:adenylate cyclase